MPSTQQTVALSNGLTVLLHHAPHLKRSAAALRVAVGSHDVPPAWPGLAHFLEHLFFLGTEQFAGENGLMAFVQQHGGQVNARTSERHTDFFFELPGGSFEAGLQRLCEMLARPRLDVTEQLREREVLHAEFIAWSRDDAARRQTKLFDGLAADHPLRAFHAGNRYSLAVPNPAFQQALREFYNQYYQAGQMTLSLSGPQPLDELQRLARHYGAQFASGYHQPQRLPPALFNEPGQLITLVEAGKLDLLIGLEGLPPDAPQALGFLLTWLTAPQHGGLRAHLQQQGWASALSAQVAYHFGAQALLHISADLLAEQAANSVIGAVFDWLEFFQAQANWPELRQEFSGLKHRQQQTLGALALACQALEPATQALSDEGLAALKAALSQCLERDFPHTEQKTAWALPPANPYLQAARAVAETTHAPAALHFSPALPVGQADAALYLRWRLAGASDALLRMLVSRLQTLSAQAHQAGVELNLAAQGNDWILHLHGLAEPLPAVAEAALRLLATPDESTWQLYRKEDPAPAPMPIRQLLGALPNVVMNQSPSMDSDPKADWRELWADARWDGLAAGFAGHELNHLSALIPGVAAGHGFPPKPVKVGVRWRQIGPGSTKGTESAESAVLLFCPAPSTLVEDQAAWRLLGSLCQAPFYQRLRVELQLGYAVFSGVRQVGGQTGLLFGVQSPSLGHADLFVHLRDFIDGLPQRVAALDDGTYAHQVETLADQFELQALEIGPAAERLWQARLSGQPLMGSQHIRKLPKAALAIAAQQLKARQGGWFCLANGLDPLDSEQ